MKYLYDAVIGALALIVAKFILFLVNQWNDNETFLQAVPSMIVSMIIVFLYGWGVRIVSVFLNEEEVKK